jgi:hypothetical protein
MARGYFHFAALCSDVQLAVPTGGTQLSRVRGSYKRTKARLLDFYVMTSMDRRRCGRPIYPGADEMWGRSTWDDFAHYLGKRSGRKVSAQSARRQYYRARDKFGAVLGDDDELSLMKQSEELNADCRRSRQAGPIPMTYEQWKIRWDRYKVRERYARAVDAVSAEASAWSRGKFVGGLGRVHMRTWREYACALAAMAGRPVPKGRRLLVALGRAMRNVHLEDNREGRTLRKAVGTPAVAPRATPRGADSREVRI